MVVHFILTVMLCLDHWHCKKKTLWQRKAIEAGRIVKRQNLKHYGWENVFLTN